MTSVESSCFISCDGLYFAVNVRASDLLGLDFGDVKQGRLQEFVDTLSCMQMLTLSHRLQTLKKRETQDDKRRSLPHAAALTAHDFTHILKLQHTRTLQTPDLYTQYVY